jgi:DNA-binding response OmpR family regulator
MKKTVLIVDDTQVIRSLLILFLSQDFNVVSFENGRTAFYWLQAGNLPDGIITDSQIPEIDGYKFLKLIKTSGVFQNIPVIMLSNTHNSDERNKLLDLGADEYIVKPFNPAELKIKLNKLIKN